MAQFAAEPVTSLYVHVPFCVRKCLYCAFYSEASGGELIDRYVGALIRELERVAADKEKVVVIKVLRGIHTCYLEIEPNWKN